MEKRIGFIGLGNMGNAILEGILAKGLVHPNEFYIYDADLETAEALQQFHGVNHVNSAKEVAKESDIVFIAVKPDVMTEILTDIQKELKKNTIVVSVATGITIKNITDSIGYEQKIIRVMPNIPALVNAGMCSITPNTEVDEEELGVVQSLLNCIGQTEIVYESQIDAVVGASGASPAFVFMFIEAIADGAIKGGLSRKQAYQFAAQAVMGSAQLLIETGKHPGELKDMVCASTEPAIEGIHALEDKGFRSAVIDAVVASIKKSQQGN